MKTLLTFLLITASSLSFGAGSVVKTITQSYQNYLINGGFDLWQRGTANANVGTNGYLADRWFATAGTYDRNAANLPTTVKYGAQLAFSSSSGWLCQRIEAGNTLQFLGQKMTISGYERSSVGTGAFKIKIDRPNSIDDYTGIGKLGTTFTNEVAATTLIATTSTTLAQWSHTFTVSSNMANYGFQICLGTDSSTTTTYQVSAVSLVEGTTAAPFRRIGTVAQELSLAQRYYEKSYSIDVVPGTAASSTNGLAPSIPNVVMTEGNYQGFVIYYSVKKRVGSHSIRTYDSNGNADRVTYPNWGGTPQHAVELSGAYTYPNAALFLKNSATYKCFELNYTADAEL